MRGDVGRGGGNAQIVKANSVKEEAGDTGRKGAAGALVYALACEAAQGEFTVRSKAGERGPRGVAEWEKKFADGSSDGYGEA